jgi:hypothetical protein
MKKTLYFLILTLLSSWTVSQVHGQDSSYRRSSDSGLFLVVKDPRLDKLVQQQIEVNEYTTRTARRNVAGFRILILNTKQRQEALDAKGLIYEKFPELKAYLWHQSPYFKLKAGNFKLKEEAELYVRKMKPFFPRGVFVINDEIDTNFLNGEKE